MAPKDHVKTQIQRLKTVFCVLYCLPVSVCVFRVSIGSKKRVRVGVVAMLLPCVAKCPQFECKKKTDSNEIKIGPRIKISSVSDSYDLVDGMSLLWNLSEWVWMSKGSQIIVGDNTYLRKGTAILFNKYKDPVRWALQSRDDGIFTFHECIKDSHLTDGILQLGNEKIDS